LRLKNTIYIGFAFLSIMVLWQAYNWLVPLYLNDYLENLFGGNEFLIGIVMGFDNLLALFMIPVVSRISDRQKEQMGSRLPLITTGVILAGSAFLFLPIAQKNIYLMIVALFVILLAMNIYRSPAVSLMPDVTPKCLHSKANAIINLMGGVGTAIGYLLLFIGGFFNLDDCFVVCGVVFVMFCCLTVLIYKVDEKKFALQMEEDENRCKNEECDVYVQDDIVPCDKDNKNKRRQNFILVLLSIFFYYMSTNSVETFMSLYSAQVLKNTNAGLVLFGMLALGSFACLYPSAVYAQKKGFRNAMLLGLCIMAGCNVTISFFGSFSFLLIPLFFATGCGMAFMIANMYPLVVSFCTKKQFAKYTGYYYSATMVAQAVTPVVSGLLFSDWIIGSMRVLMPYSAIFLVLSAIILLFVPAQKKQPV